MTFFLRIAGVLALVLAASESHALPLDVQLRGLGPYFQNGDQTPRDRFRLLTSEIGFALSPRVNGPATTTGMSGFEVGFDMTLVTLNTQAEHWRNGVTEQERLRGTFPGSTQAVTGLHLRKGLPFSLELEAHLNYFINSSMFMIGGDLKYCFLEGYKFLPNLSARAGVGRLMNADEIDLTTVNLDITVSKSFAAGGVMEITPIVSYGIVFMNANSAVLDNTPDNTSDNISIEQANGSLYTIPEAPLAQNFHHRISVGFELHTFIFVFNYQFDLGLVTGGRPVFMNTFKLALQF